MTRGLLLPLLPRLCGESFAVLALVIALPTTAWAQSGYGLRTDGTSYVEVPDEGHPTLRVTGSLTMALWHRYEGAAAGFGRILGKTSAPSQSGEKFYGLYLNGTVGGQQSPSFYVSGTTQNASAASPAYLPNFPQWTHLAGVFNAEAGDITLYVNGVAAQTVPAPLKNLDPGTGALRLGQDARANVGTRGTTDDVTLWNRALSADEIKVLPSRALQPTEPGIILFWNFETLEDRAGVSYVLDGSGNGNDGAIVGAQRLLVQDTPPPPGTTPPALGQGGAGAVKTPGDEGAMPVVEGAEPSTAPAEAAAASDTNAGGCSYGTSYGAPFAKLSLFGIGSLLLWQRWRRQRSGSVAG